MQAVATTPFAVLTAVVAPAILTNASSVLALGTSNRVARVVDRTRIVAKELASIDPGNVHYPSLATQLAHLQVPRTVARQDPPSVLCIPWPLCRLGVDRGHRLSH